MFSVYPVLSLACRMDPLYSAIIYFSHRVSRWPHKYLGRSSDCLEHFFFCSRDRSSLYLPLPPGNSSSFQPAISSLSRSLTPSLLTLVFIFPYVSLFVPSSSQITSLPDLFAHALKENQTPWRTTREAAGLRDAIQRPSRGVRPSTLLG
jgi:hypothetical protein